MKTEQTYNAVNTGNARVHMPDGVLMLTIPIRSGIGKDIVKIPLENADGGPAMKTFLDIFEADDLWEIAHGTVFRIVVKNNCITQIGHAIEEIWLPTKPSIL